MIALCHFDSPRFPSAIIEGDTIEAIRKVLADMCVFPFQVSKNRKQFISEVAVWNYDPDGAQYDKKNWLGRFVMGVAQDNIRLGMWEEEINGQYWNCHYYWLKRDGTIMSPSNLATYDSFKRRELRTRGKRAKEWNGPVQEFPTCPYCTGVA